MLNDVWEEGTAALFVSPVATEPSPTLGFHHLHPRDRFWELLEMGSITAGRAITREERKAMEQGHAQGNLADPVRQIFVQKKTSQIIRASVGIAYLRHVPGISTEKDKGAHPEMDEIQTFLRRCEERPVRLIGCVMDADIFFALFHGLHPDIEAKPGKQPFTVAGAEVWFLGSSQAALKGEALLAQEDLFLEVGERLAAVRREGAPS